MRLLPGEHRVGRFWLIAGGVALVLLGGAYLFERPAAEDAQRAFLKADPTASADDLEITKRHPLTYRLTTTSRREVYRGDGFFKREVATTLWCARDRRRPDRWMALNFHHSMLPLVSGPRTVARSWDLGLGITASNMIAECDRLFASGPPAMP